MREKSLSQWQNPMGILLGVLVLGSIWGMSEATIGGGLHAAGFPYRSGLLAGIGIGIMGAALVIYKRPAMLLGIGSVAVLVKLLAVPILGVPIMCKANSSIAVLLEALALTIVGIMLVRQMDKNVYRRMGCGALAATLGAISFFFIGMQVAPCNYLLGFKGNLGGFLVSEGLVWAAFSAILLPAGYLVGVKLKRKTLPWLVRRMPLYYATSVSIIAFCWGISAVTISWGL